MRLLEQVSLENLITSIVVVIVVLSIIVEKISKFPFQPWSKFFRWIGENITKETNKKIDELEKQYLDNKKAISDLDKKLELKFDEKQREDDEKEAKRLRASIIAFADSCRVGNKHTQNHFENIMRDYSDYISYCERHEIPNHFIESEYKYIENLYQERLVKNDFLEKVQEKDNK